MRKLVIRVYIRENKFESLSGVSLDSFSLNLILGVNSPGEHILLLEKLFFLLEKLGKSLIIFPTGFILETLRLS